MEIYKLEGLYCLRRRVSIDVTWADSSLGISVVSCWLLTTSATHKISRDVPVVSGYETDSEYGKCSVYECVNWNATIVSVYSSSFSGDTSLWSCWNRSFRKACETTVYSYLKIKAGTFSRSQIVTQGSSFVQIMCWGRVGTKLSGFYKLKIFKIMNWFHLISVYFRHL